MIISFKDAYDWGGNQYYFYININTFYMNIETISDNLSFSAIFITYS